MKIKNVTEDAIEFDNGDIITSEHYPTCCEYNYADFKQVDNIALETDFEYPIQIECDENNGGFRFGNKPNKMFYIPCYSEQNGYYSCDIDIHYIPKNKEDKFGNTISAVCDLL